MGAPKPRSLATIPLVGERHGQVTLTVLPGAGYQLPVNTFETVNVYDDAPPPPAQPRVGRGFESGSRLTLRWAADPEASGYEVRWGEAGQPVRQTARMSAPEYTTPDLSPGVQYAFEVASCNDTGCGEASPEVVGSVGPAGTPPTANAGPDLEALPGTTVTLQGKGSINPHGKWWRMAHLWTQTAGPEVTLSDPTKGLPSFTVPAGGNTNPAARLEAEAGYGLAAFGDGFTGTPYAGFGYSDTERRYRLGWRLTRADDPGPFAFSLEASRRESANDEEPKHGIGFRLTRR